MRPFKAFDLEEMRVKEALWGDPGGVRNKECMRGKKPGYFEMVAVKRTRAEAADEAAI